MNSSPRIERNQLGKMSSRARPPAKARKQPPHLMLFVALMMFVIAIQGTYLGYVVGMLTTLERRFGISSEPSGSLLSIYDIGHTIAILLISYLGEVKGVNFPRITGIGVILSALSMFVLALPVFLFGSVSTEDLHQNENKILYAATSRCDSYREDFGISNSCQNKNYEHTEAFLLLAVGQFLAGVFSAPFNTIAYVYIDRNVDDRRRSPFLLGLLTSMFAFGPALGFGLSAFLTRVYTTLGNPPHELTPHDEEWIGAWWMGFLICGVLYLCAALPFFFFPQSYRSESMELEMKHLHKPHLPPAQFEEDSPEQLTFVEKFKKSFKEFIQVATYLIQNPVYVSMVLGWMFGSYLIAGYSTYLPKYIETQFSKTASAADLYAGLISVGAIASSTALGGWLLSRTSVGVRSAILLLLGSWLVVFLTYLGGMFFGCEQAPIHGLHYSEVQRWHFREDLHSSCVADCRCSGIMHFDPVHHNGVNYYSPCYAGCVRLDEYDQWTDCRCLEVFDDYGSSKNVDRGLLHPNCTFSFVAYMTAMFIGLFLGNLFFMVTMMIVLRCVSDDEKLTALSLASCVTNLFGFIPAPLLFGHLIDAACSLWHDQCPDARGNCVLYDNQSFRYSFHLGSAGMQLLAVLSVAACWLFARKKAFPEEEEDE